MNQDQDPNLVSANPIKPEDHTNVHLVDVGAGGSDDLMTNQFQNESPAEEYQTFDIKGQIISKSKLFILNLKSFSNSDASQYEF